MKKIIHFVEDLAPSSGVTSVVKSLVRNGNNENLKSTIILTGSNSHLREIEYVNIDKRPVKESAFRKVVSLARLLLYLLPNRKNVIFHMHTIWDPVQTFFLIIAKLMGIHTVCSTHGMLMKKALTYSKVKKRLALNLYLKKIINKFDKIHVTSDIEEKDLSSFQLKNIVKIPLGLNCSHTVYKWEEKKNIVLFMSRIHPIKGIENLLHAWCRFDTKGWKLLIAGPSDQSYLKFLQNIIQKYPDEQDIVFHEEVDNDGKNHLFGISKIFVLPSKAENFGLVILESLSAGLPVVVSNNTPWKGIEKYECGWSTEVSISELEKTLSYVLNLHDNELRSHSRNAHKFACQNFEWNMIFKDYIKKLYGN